MEERKKSPKCFAIQSSERKSGIAFAFSTWRKKCSTTMFQLQN